MAIRVISKQSISGATGQSYTLTEDDAGEEISVTLTRTSDGKFLKSAKIAILSDEALPGDLNFDGTVNTMDALLLYGGTGGARTMTEEQKAVSDMNGDGSVNMMDALLLYKQASGA